MTDCGSFYPCVCFSGPKESESVYANGVCGYGAVYDCDLCDVHVYSPMNAANLLDGSPFYLVRGRG